jgi:hypothetical protein
MPPEFFFGRFFCAKFLFPGLSGGFSPKAEGLFPKSRRASLQKPAGFSIKAGGLFSKSRRAFFLKRLSQKSIGTQMTQIYMICGYYLIDN